MDPQGPQGLAGPAGSTGAKGMTWTGPWSAFVAYVPDDVVEVDGSSHVALVSTTVGSQPPNSQWGLVAARGAAGADGAQGLVGPAGSQGPQGDAGPAGVDGAPGATGPSGPPGPAGPAGTFAIFGNEADGDLVVAGGVVTIGSAGQFRSIQVAAGATLRVTSPAILRVTGSVVVDGSIVADPSPGGAFEQSASYLTRHDLARALYEDAVASEGSPSAQYGGSAGGSLAILAGGSIVVSGSVSASGGAGQTGTGAGAGAGGGGYVGLAARAISISGVVTANGGNGGSGGSYPEGGCGGGGGGVHLVAETAPQVTGSITAQAGLDGRPQGTPWGPNAGGGGAIAEDFAQYRGSRCGAAHLPAWPAGGHGPGLGAPSQGPWSRQEDQGPSGESCTLRERLAAWPGAPAPPSNWRLPSPWEPRDPSSPTPTTRRALLPSRGAWMEPVPPDVTRRGAAAAPRGTR